MFPPLYNDEFRDLLEDQDTDTNSEAMAKLIPAAFVRQDEVTGRSRPALQHLEGAAAVLGVMPVEVFTRVLDDVLFGSTFAADGEVFCSHDFLAELAEWLVLEKPAFRTQVLGGFAAHKRMRAEDRNALHELCASPPSETGASPSGDAFHSRPPSP